MKRFRSEEQREMEINIAKVLMLLAAGGTDDVSSAQTLPSRMFQCKTCSRQFTSFQALGGHRASHKKPRHEDGPDHLPLLLKPKVHECSICGLEFSIGQALGGHMRRHRANPEGFGRQDMVEKKSRGGKRVLWLDLNFPPLDEETDKLGLGLGIETVNY